MELVKAATIRVPDAQLYYEVRGSGPMLLMIAAGAGDAGSYLQSIEYMLRHYTIVTYDRRGFARSPVDDPEQPIEISTHSHDIDYILDALGAEKADVFGSSIGALIALDFALHSPQRIGRLVVHEPPIIALVSDEEQAMLQKAQKNIQAAYETGGVNAVIQQLTTSLGIVHSSRYRENTGLPQASIENARHNRESFIRYDMRAATRYRLDIDALRTAPVWVVVAGGHDSHETWPYHAAQALAEQLGSPLAEFPGNHSGFIDYPSEFADTLQAVLTD